MAKEKADADQAPAYRKYSSFPAEPASLVCSHLRERMLAVSASGTPIQLDAIPL
jgi:hypothetical protein